MKKRISMLLVIVLCLCMCACGSKEDTQEDVQENTDKSSSSSSDEDSMPSFSTVDIEGNTVTSDIFSQVDLTVVNFWATYCNPCIGEMPELAEWSESMPDNVQIVGIVVDVASEDSSEYQTAKQIVEKTGANFQHLLPTAEMKEVMSKLIGVPTTIFVDKEGRIVGRPIVGADVGGYKKFVEEYLNEQE